MKAVKRLTATRGKLCSKALLATASLATSCAYSCLETSRPVVETMSASSASTASIVTPTVVLAAAGAAVTGPATQICYGHDSERRGTIGQTHNQSIQNPAERLCWEVSRRDGCRLARRLYRKQLVEGVYRLDEGAALDNFFHFLQARGVTALPEQMHGAAIQWSRAWRQ
jgi:hypothetical protein